MGRGLCHVLSVDDTRLSASLVNQGQGTTSCITQLWSIATLITKTPYLTCDLSPAYDLISANSSSGVRTWGLNTWLSVSPHHRQVIPVCSKTEKWRRVSYAETRTINRRSSCIITLVATSKISKHDKPNFPVIFLPEAPAFFKSPPVYNIKCVDKWSLSWEENVYLCLPIQEGIEKCWRKPHGSRPWADVDAIVREY